MIALGGTIGTGLFVGSGQTLARGGPAFILGSYMALSFFVFCVVTAITEVGAYLPTPGSSMNLFGFRYVSRTMGFSLGWLYFYSLGILVPYEITAYVYIGALTTRITHYVAGLDSSSTIGIQTSISRSGLQL
jgi:amino acid transporter